VKISGCNLVSLLETAAGREPFRQTLASSPSLASALVKNLSHQQKRIRLASIGTLERMLISTGTSETFVSTVSHLAQRLFDPMPEVRMAVGRLAASLLKGWQCRTSNFPLLVPLLVTGYGIAQLSVV
jgi:dynein assembly factor 5